MRRPIDARVLEPKDFRGPQGTPGDRADQEMGETSGEIHYKWRCFCGINIGKGGKTVFFGGENRLDEHGLNLSKS
jgi:hypothetical protein